MKIYAICGGDGPTAYAPKKRDAIRMARERLAEIRAAGAHGFVEVIECLLPRKRDAAYLCDVLSTFGGSFAEEQHVIFSEEVGITNRAQMLWSDALNSVIRE